MPRAECCAIEARLLPPFDYAALRSGRMMPRAECCAIEAHLLPPFDFYFALLSVRSGRKQIR